METSMKGKYERTELTKARVRVTRSEALIESRKKAYEDAVLRNLHLKAEVKRLEAEQDAA